jgi:Tol biopolymer transport system component
MAETDASYEARRMEDTMLWIRTKSTLLLGTALLAVACGGSDSTGPSTGGAGPAVAFLTETQGMPLLGVVNADGSGFTALDSVRGWYDAYSWSPDGGRIAFPGGTDAASYGIYVVHGDGTGLTKLATNPEWWAGIWGDVAWSPDGSKIAYVTSGGGMQAVSADGTGSVTLATNACGIWPPNPISWSPDGKRMAYCAHSDDGWPEIYTVNADGSGQTRLTHGYRGPNGCCGDENTAPSWSPDGTKIAYQRRAFATSTFDLPKFDVHVINADGTGDASLTDSLPNGPLPVWSPVGARLAFWNTSNSGLGQIYVMNADGSGLARVTMGASYDQCQYISWAADGERLAYCAHGDVYTVRIDGTDVRNLTNSSAFEAEPRLSPR